MSCDRKGIPAVLLALISMLAPARAPATAAFQRYNVSDGLANNVGFDVAEDKYGFVSVDLRVFGYKDEPFVLAKDVQ